MHGTCTKLYGVTLYVEHYDTVKNFEWFQPSSAKQMRPSFFRDFMRYVVAIPYRPFYTTYQYNLQGSRYPRRPLNIDPLITGPIYGPETSVRI